VRLPGWLRPRYMVLAAAVVVPPVVCAVLVPFRVGVSNTHAALVLVLVVVAIAANGYRTAGLLAALSAAVSFDLLLTEPYGRLAISRRLDVETTVLLLLVGAAVTELAGWGRRQQARASRDAGYLAGLHTAAEAAAAGGSPTTLIADVGQQLTGVLGLRGCRFHYGTGRHHPLLRHDGRVLRDGAVLDVDRDGLPTDIEIELRVEGGGHFQGRFLLTAAAGSRPTVEQRLVAVSLADQVGAFLGGYP
jgi:K+-sensing histidine kinase KdpD